MVPGSYGWSSAHRDKHARSTRSACCGFPGLENCVSVGATCLWFHRSLRREGLTSGEDAEKETDTTRRARSGRRADRSHARRVDHRRPWATQPSRRRTPERRLPSWRMARRSRCCSRTSICRTRQTALMGLNWRALLWSVAPACGSSIRLRRADGRDDCPIC